MGRFRAAPRLGFVGGIPGSRTSNRGPTTTIGNSLAVLPLGLLQRFPPSSDFFFSGCASTRSRPGRVVALLQVIRQHFL